MKKCVFLFMCGCLIVASHGFAQNNNNHGLGNQTKHGLGSQSIKSSDNQKEHLNNTQVFSGNKSTEKKRKSTLPINKSHDFALYSNVVKQNGWMTGVGKQLTHDQASHMVCYYKFSQKNEAGNWTLLEAYNGYGKLTTSHSIGTYLVNQNDEYDNSSNSNWKEKLNTVCKWIFIADESGKEIVQERGLDEENNIVYCYSPMKITVGVYIGSFTDAWGIPIYMRTDSLGKHEGQANFVQIYRDDNGYETLLSFVDENGYPQKNKDGAYKTSKTFDAQGFQTREASLNILGQQMNDLCGNCGWENTHNEYGSILTARYFDANNKPIRMPGTRGANKVYGYEFKYDDYNRETDRWYLDSLGNRSTNEYGVYHQVCGYNDNGEVTSLISYDKNGIPIAGDSLGIAKRITEYDKYGNLLNLQWLNANFEPINGYGDCCQRIFNYSNDGSIILSESEYVVVNDSVVLSFDYKRDKLGNEIRKWCLNDLVKIDSVDSEGRETLVAYYDLEMNPKMHNDDYARKTTSYNDDKGYSKSVEKWFDENGEYAVPYNNDNRDWCISITEVDSVKHQMITSQYFFSDQLRQKFVKQYDDKFDNIIAQWDVTPYGEQARVGWWNNLHYRISVDYTLYGSLLSFTGYNEFDEPGYLVELNDNPNVYYYYKLKDGAREYFDENGSEISEEEMSDFKENLPKAFCIEVTDTSKANPLGLRNGDIILSYGDWKVCEDLRSNINDFYLETILKSNERKDITILRHDIPNKTSHLIKIQDLPEGRTSDLGFYPHQICYTQKEKARLHDACKNSGFTYGKPIAQRDTTVLMAVQLKGGFIQSRFYHFDMYDVKDPGFLLYAQEKYTRKDHTKAVDTWSFVSNDLQTWKDKNMYNSSFSGETELYLTQNFKNLKKVSKSSSGNRGMRIIPISITLEQLSLLKRSFESHKEELPLPKEKKTIISVKPKQLIGKWENLIQEEDKEAVVLLDMKKDNHIDIFINFNMGDDELSLEFTYTQSGLWKIDNGTLKLSLDSDNQNIAIKNLKKSDLSDAEVEDYKPLFAVYLKRNIDEVLGSILSSEYDIVEVLPKEIILESGDSIYKFSKVK